MNRLASATISASPHRSVVEKTAFLPLQRASKYIRSQVRALIHMDVAAIKDGETVGSWRFKQRSELGVEYLTVHTGNFVMNVVLTPVGKIFERLVVLLDQSDDTDPPSGGGNSIPFANSNCLIIWVSTPLSRDWKNSRKETDVYFDHMAQHMLCEVYTLGLIFGWAVKMKSPFEENSSKSVNGVLEPHTDCAFSRTDWMNAQYGRALIENFCTENFTKYSTFDRKSPNTLVIHAMCLGSIGKLWFELCKREECLIDKGEELDVATSWPLALACDLFRHQVVPADGRAAERTIH